MNKKNNGVNRLSEAQENMRMEIVELELKARYWKAQYDIRNYTLMAEAIQPEYDKYLEAQRIKNEELRQEYEKEMEKVKQEMIDKGELKTEPVENVEG